MFKSSKTYPNACHAVPFYTSPSLAMLFHLTWFFWQYWVPLSWFTQHLFGPASPNFGGLWSVAPVSWWLWRLLILEFPWQWLTIHVQQARSGCSGDKKTPWSCQRPTSRAEAYFGWPASCPRGLCTCFGQMRGLNRLLTWWRPRSICWICLSNHFRFSPCAFSFWLRFPQSCWVSAATFYFFWFNDAQTLFLQLHSALFSKFPDL